MPSQVIVVEGIHDRQKLESIYPGITCIVTGGTALDDATIGLVQAAQAARGVILFLDPDHPGRTLTDRLVAAVPGAGIAFLPRREAISRDGRKVGVEHASAAAIDKALAGVRTIAPAPREDVTPADLFVRHLSGCADAAARRNRAATRLGLPPSNAKTLVRWMNMLGIPPERLDG